MSSSETLTLRVLKLAAICILISIQSVLASSGRPGEINIDQYREKVKQMFYHAYNGYLNHAYPYDELQPLTCGGHDTWGSYSLTLIDALDTLVVMGNHSEFRRIAEILINKGESFFDIDINVSVFETNIRIVGGLLSAHLMMKRAGMVLEPAWPCSGPLLRMADNIARKILPAFDTPTGMPYGTVNLRHGVPQGETTVTCTAGVGTFIVEFGALSRLTGDPIFEKTAIRAIRALWKYRSSLGLLGNHVDVANGKWTAQDSGIGGGIDSYFEYLVKGSIMFNIPELLHMFREYEVSIKKYLKRDDWYMWAQMSKGTITQPLFTSLDGYWPSIKGMLGDIDEAMKTMHNFHQVWRQFGFTPEYYNILKADVHQGREGYPLRPEIIESVMYLYRATKDPYLLEIGVDIVEAIEHSARTSCGYATVKDVRDHRLEDRMESFFLAETTKYLYLLFDPNNFIHNNGSHGDIISTPSGKCIIEAGGYIFNTEAHPLDLAAVHCCSAAKKEQDQILQDFHDNLDLLSLLDLTDPMDDEWILAEKKKRKELRKKRKEKAEKIRKEQEEWKAKRAGKVQDEEEDDDSGEGDGYDDAEFESFDVDDEIEEEIVADEEEADHQAHEKKKRLQVIDMTSFTEAERNFTHIFMKTLQMESILKNISAEVASKMKSHYAETEFEHFANNVARKLLEVDDKSLTAESNITLQDTAQTEDAGESNKTQSTEEVLKEQSSEVNQAESQIDREKIAPLEQGNIKDGGGIASSEQENTKESLSKQTHSQRTEMSDKKKTMHSLDSMVKITVTDNNGVQTTVTQTSSGQADQQVVIVQIPKDANVETAEVSTASPSPSSSSSSSSTTNKEENVLPNQESSLVKDTIQAVERFKSHIDLEIQFQEDKQTHGEESSGPSKPGTGTTTSPLENKRSNIMSITTTILKMFSGSGTENGASKEESVKRQPSLAGLYVSLSNYSLNYFHDPLAMHCPAQPFHSRISIYGEMFPDV